MARDRIRRIVEPVPPAVLAALAVAQQARDAIPAGYTALARARVAALLEARSAGLTWRQTAGLLGISQERCHSLVREAQRGAGSVSDQAGGGWDVSGRGDEVSSATKGVALATSAVANALGVAAGAADGQMPMVHIPSMQSRL